LPAGNNSLTIVAFELSGAVSVQRISNIQVLLGSGDVNNDGLVTIDDLYSLVIIPNGTPSSSPLYTQAGDMNRNNSIDASDKNSLEQTTLRAAESLRMRGTQR
jgi:hypothetical protein